MGHDRAHDTTTRTETGTPPMAIDPGIVTISKHLPSVANDPEGKGDHRETDAP